jgi:hypothetical protein
MPARLVLRESLSACEGRVHSSDSLLVAGLVPLGSGVVIRFFAFLLGLDEGLSNSMQVLGNDPFSTSM